MELYNSLIKDTKAFFDGKNPQRWSYNERDCWTDLGSRELVLQKDAAYELGAMGKGSANYVLFTSNAELVEHDEVELYGPDLKDIKGDCDFARIVLLRVGMLDEDDEIVYRTLKDIEFAKYHVYPEGYMVRMSPESYREQVRVSKTALRKGVSFKRIGIELQVKGDDIVIPQHDGYEIDTFMDGSIMTFADAPWPGLSPDLLSVFLVVATQARGSVLIHQKMFESRLFFVDKLIDMGAQIILCDPHRAAVIGSGRLNSLRATNMVSPDIRAGIAMLIAAMSARGTSHIHNIDQIDRGYENIDKRLNAIGANIMRVSN